MSGLLDNQQVFESLYDYIHTKDWWMFICPFHGPATDMMNVIEHKFYAPKTEANGDFHMIIYPPFGSIFTAKKTRMSFKNLLDTIPEFEGHDEKQDIIALVNEDSEIDRVFWHEIVNGISDVAKIRKENIKDGC